MGEGSSTFAAIIRGSAKIFIEHFGKNPPPGGAELANTYANNPGMKNGGSSIAYVVYMAFAMGQDLLSCEGAVPKMDTTRYGYFQDSVP